MGLFSFLRGDDISQKAITASPAVLEVAASRQLNTFVPLGGTNLNTGRINSVYVEAQNATYGWMYLYQPSVRTVVDYVARNISQLALKVYERIADDEREHKGDHPAAQLMRNPNDWTTGIQFIFEFVCDFLVYDNAYALKLKNGKLTLVRLDPPMVGLAGQSYHRVEAYRVYLRDGTWRDVPPEDMIHWRGYEPSDPRRGASKLETLREVLAADLTSRKAVTEQFRAGLTASGWIQRPLDAPVITPESLDRLKKDISNRLAASKREVPILEEGMTFQQASITPEDAQYLEARDKTKEEVCAIYGLPPIPPKNEEERKAFYADVLPPLTEVLASVFDLHILKAEFMEDDHYFEFSKEKMMDEIYKTLTSASGRPVLLTDEARAKLDLPPVDTGDELVTPANVIVGDNPKPSIGVNPIQDPNKPPDDGSFRTEDEPTPAGKALGIVDEVWNHKARPLLPRRGNTYDRRNSWGKKYEGLLASTFERQRRSVIAKSLSNGRALKALEDERWDRELAKDLNLLSMRHFTAEGDHAAFRMASSFDPDYGENWIGAKALGSAGDINRTTREHIQDKGVEDAFALAVGARAAAAGLAYSTDVAAFATKVAIEQDGGPRTVTITGGSCDVCAPFQGTFPADEVEWPSYHPNCSCIADIDSGTSKSVGPELEVVTKAMQGYVKTIEALATAATNGNTEGLMALAKAISEQKPQNVILEEGAIQVPVDVQTPPVTFEKGAFENHVEAPPPSNVTLEEGAITVQQGDTHVEAAQAPDVNVDVAAPNVNVEMKGGKKTVTFSDGTEAKIEETDERPDQD